MDNDQDQDQTEEAALYEETHVILTCRACGALWEYETVEAVGCKASALIECPLCSVRTILTV